VPPPLLPKHLTRREKDLIRCLFDPSLLDYEDMAKHLGISTGMVAKVYASDLFHKIGIKFGGRRMLMLWAIAHRGALGLSLPTADQMPGYWPPVLLHDGEPAGDIPLCV
jgi:hypothetical protein